MPPSLAHRLRGDRAFERLYRRHVAAVERYALTLVGNPTDAEDVTQTTFLNAYRAYRRGERPRSAQSWLLAIAHNVCLQRFRELGRRAEEVMLDEDAAVALPANDDVPRPDELRRALESLRFTQRSALVMRELEGRSYGEIGQVLGVSTSAVETLLVRARRALREQLDGSLTCAEAKLAIGQQPGRSEHSPLRAHLRVCADCASLARRERARRGALRGLGAIPLPPSLASLFGGGAGGGVAAKAAAVLAAGAVAGGVGLKAAEAPWRATEGAVAPVAREVSPPRAPVARTPASHARPAVSAPAAVPAVVRPSPRSPRARVQPSARTKLTPVAAKPARPTPQRVPPAVEIAVAVEPEPAPAPAAPQEPARPEPKPEPPRANAQRRGPPPGHTPPGQSRKPAARKPDKDRAENHAQPAPPAEPPAREAPPGQAQEAGVPPGQAKKDDVATAPPGQEAKAEDDTEHVPPGQAKKS